MTRQTKRVSAITVFALAFGLLVGQLATGFPTEAAQTTTKRAPKTTKLTKPTKSTTKPSVKTTKKRSTVSVSTAATTKVPSGIRLTSSTASTDAVTGAGPTTSGTATTSTTATTIVPATSVPPTPRLIVGANTHPIWSDGDVWEPLLASMAAMGARSVRLDVGWTNVEPVDGKWDESYFDRLRGYLDAVKAAKLDALIVFQASPAWSTANGKSEAPPRDPARFGRAIGELAKRMKGSVAAYEIWNEADSRDFFTGTMDDYVRLLQAAYPAVRAADPDALVVLSGPSSVDVEWLRSMYRAGGKGFFDVAAVHPYSSPADMAPDNSVASRFSFEWLPKFREVMTENGDNKPVWITEIGWSAHANTGNEFAWEKGVSEQDQAAFSRRVLTKIVESHPWITRVYFYNARDRADQNVHQANFGLLRRDLSPKPVYAWLKDTIAKLPA